MDSNSRPQIQAIAAWHTHIVDELSRFEVDKQGFEYRAENAESNAFREHNELMQIREALQLAAALFDMTEILITAKEDTLETVSLEWARLKAMFLAAHARIGGPVVKATTV